MNFPSRPNSSFRCPTSIPGHTKHLSEKKNKKKNLSADGNVTSWSHGTLGEQDAQTNCCSRRDELLANCPPRNSPLVSRLSSGFFPPPCSMSRCWSSPVMGCGGVTQCANLPLQLKSSGGSFGILPLRFSCAPRLPRGPFSARRLTFSAQSAGC